MIIKLKILLLVIFGSMVFGQNQYSVKFDISSLEKIMLQPEEVLKDINYFWENDEAYKLTTVWLKGNNRPLPLKYWGDSFKSILATDPTERGNNKMLLYAKEIVKNEEKFNDEALTLILKYLPESAPKFNTTIYLTAKIPGRAFTTNNNIVVNMDAINYSGNINAQLNVLVHEVFHIAFNECGNLWTDFGTGNNSIDNLIKNLQNEGMATYVGFKALPLFNFESDSDYKGIQNDSVVTEKYSLIKNLFLNLQSMSETEINKANWDIGIVKRAFYVFGAFMAKTIEDKAGIELLKKTVTRGPEYFIEKYNSVASDDKKLPKLTMEASK